MTPHQPNPAEVPEKRKKKNFAEHLWSASPINTVSIHATNPHDLVPRTGLEKTDNQ
jgi:hypothetical protein